MKKCLYCGKELPDDAVMCPIDHTSLDSETLVKGKTKPTPITFRLKSIIFVLVALPLSIFLFPFIMGFFNLNQGYLLLIYPIMLLGLIAGAGVIAMCVEKVHWFKRILLGIGASLVLFILLFLSFIILPPGAVSWTLGFAANFRLTKHPAQIQKWAVGVLDRYDKATVALNTNVEYWAVGKEKLQESEIPVSIRNLWWIKPSVGVASITDEGWYLDPKDTNILNSISQNGRLPKLTHCVAFSWYLTGVLVGRPDFESKWNPWYLKKIEPGIYVYCGMK